MLHRFLTSRSPLIALALALGALASAQAQATAAPDAALTKAAAAPSDTAKVLRLVANPSPLAAQFVMTVTPPAGAQGSAPRRADWYFVRDAQQIALLKGAIDEAWHRDAQGRVWFERVFHEDQRAVDYSTGELAILEVRVDWVALATFIDPRELLALKVVATQGQGADERVQLRGALGAETLEVEWLPALQLPASLTRTGKDGAVVRIELQQHATTAPAAWPVPGARSVNYLRLDAADFGDMDYDPVVKKSEALDIRLGWRTAHKHD